MPFDTGSVSSPVLIPSAVRHGNDCSAAGQACFHDHKDHDRPSGCSIASRKSAMKRAAVTPSTIRWS
ncbi:MAG TPA: hypothetical protein VHT22_06320, partial [Casimicrobiaceae bacterium]|nr:hypothetical protein [Casimicrobiaceae bacterium]